MASHLHERRVPTATPAPRSDVPYVGSGRAREIFLTIARCRAFVLFTMPAANDTATVPSSTEATTSAAASARTCELRKTVVDFDRFGSSTC